MNTIYIYTYVCKTLYGTYTLSINLYIQLPDYITLKVLAHHSKDLILQDVTSFLKVFFIQTPIPTNSLLRVLVSL